VEVAHRAVKGRCSTPLRGVAGWACGRLDCPRGRAAGFRLRRKGASRGYGDQTGRPAGEHIRDWALYLGTPCPGGQSWREAVDRVGRLLRDLRLRWQDRRVLVIGHVATR
jgi:hypothetical protein